MGEMILFNKYMHGTCLLSPKLSPSSLKGSPKSDICMCWVEKQGIFDPPEEDGCVEDLEGILLTSPACQLMDLSIFIAKIVERGPAWPSQNPFYFLFWGN